MNDSRYTVSLITNGDDSSTTNVVLGDSPVIIEYVNDDNIYSPAKYSTATIKLITNDYLPDLYSGSAQGVKVSVEGLYKWNGYFSYYHSFHSLKPDSLHTVFPGCGIPCPDSGRGV